MGKRDRLATEVLADLEIPAGTYHELRLIVESASVTLADGYEFRDGTTESVMKVPSGAQTGIKLKLRSSDPDSTGSGGVGRLPFWPTTTGSYDAGSSGPQRRARSPTPSTC